MKAIANGLVHRISDDRHRAHCGDCSWSYTTVTRGMARAMLNLHTARHGKGTER